eukprot:TRINITY_DN2623_c0_g1_i1.p2 TRINITY_DN2623_c0_g1~~TRINITY_DN2623_c0_g1_i1.p2  ORF type:complete len:108 (+),score=27.80 TRINITY_DN2623_c0_g1_i1:49-324(+)
MPGQQQLPGTFNEEGKMVDLYIPRKCSATNRIIAAKDHTAVQINIGRVGADGLYTGSFDTVCFCGAVRGRGRSDIEMNRLAIEKGIMKPVA